MRSILALVFSLNDRDPAPRYATGKACHCSIVFLRRTLHLFRFLKSFIVKSFPTRQLWTGIAPPYSFSS